MPPKAAPTHETPAPTTTATEAPKKAMSVADQSKVIATWHKDSEIFVDLLVRGDYMPKIPGKVQGAKEGSADVVLAHPSVLGLALHLPVDPNDPDLVVCDLGISTRGSHSSLADRLQNRGEQALNVFDVHTWVSVLKEKEGRRRIEMSLAMHMGFQRLLEGAPGLGSNPLSVGYELESRELEIQVYLGLLKGYVDEGGDPPGDLLGLGELMLCRMACMKLFQGGRTEEADRLRTEFRNGRALPELLRELVAAQTVAPAPGGKRTRRQ